jgi:hypothetical protein
MYNIEIKKGHTFRYDIWFGGEPPPLVTWERHDGVISADTDERISLDLFSKKTVYCQRNTVLTVKKVNRAKERLHCKKRFATSPSPAGLSLTNLSRAGIIRFFPPRKSLVSDIPAGNGIVSNLFWKKRWV